MDRLRIHYCLFSLLIFISCSGEEENASTETTKDIDSIVTLDTVAAAEITEDVEEQKESFQVPHFEVQDNSCFPEPNERFKGWVEKDSMWTLFPMMDPVYVYLITHFDSIGTKKEINTKDEYSGGWEQSFSNGMKFTEIEHYEIGSDNILNTSCTDLRKARNKFFTVIDKPEDNEWNSDSTSFSPDGAGCGYDFKQGEDSTVTISWYCGC